MHLTAPAMRKAWTGCLHSIAIAALVVGLAPATADAATHRHHHHAVKKTSVVFKKRIGRTYHAYRAHRRARSVVLKAAADPSYGEREGLNATPDELGLRANVALVVDQETNQVLFSKNESAVLPIASLTKLMTGLLISEAKLPMDEEITITQDDVDTEKFTGSRLSVGSKLTRGELMHLALMASENRAAHALGRTYPGGLAAFVSAMNAKAKLLGMNDTHYVEPTGLSFHNESSAHDLATLVATAYQDPLLRELTTSPEHEVVVGRRTLQYHTTNRLVKSPDWSIGLQKTGYIREAGQCMVLQAKIAGRKLIMVLLDSTGHLGRILDAERVRRWVESNPNIGNPIKAVSTSG